MYCFLAGFSLDQRETASTLLYCYESVRLQGTSLKEFLGYEGQVVDPQPHVAASGGEVPAPAPPPQPRSKPRKLAPNSDACGDGNPGLQATVNAVQVGQQQPATSSDQDAALQVRDLSETETDDSETEGRNRHNRRKSKSQVQKPTHARTESRKTNNRKAAQGTGTVSTAALTASQVSNKGKSARKRSITADDGPRKTPRPDRSPQPGPVSMIGADSQSLMQMLSSLQSVMPMLASLQSLMPMLGSFQQLISRLEGLGLAVQHDITTKERNGSGSQLQIPAWFSPPNMFMTHAYWTADYHPSLKALVDELVYQTMGGCRPYQYCMPALDDFRNLEIHAPTMLAHRFLLTPIPRDGYCHIESCRVLMAALGYYVTHEPCMTQKGVASRKQLYVIGRSILLRFLLPNFIPAVLTVQEIHPQMFKFDLPRFTSLVQEQMNEADLELWPGPVVCPTMMEECIEVLHDFLESRNLINEDDFVFTSGHIAAAFDRSYPAKLSGDWDVHGSPLLALAVFWRHKVRVLFYHSMTECIEQLPCIDDACQGLLIKEHHHYTVGVPVAHRRRHGHMPTLGRWTQTLRMHCRGVLWASLPMVTVSMHYVTVSAPFLACGYCICTDNTVSGCQNAETWLL